MANSKKIVFYDQHDLLGVSSTFDWSNVVCPSLEETFPEYPSIGHLTKFFEDVEMSLFYDSGIIRESYLTGRSFLPRELLPLEVVGDDIRKKCLRAYAVGRFERNSEIGPIGKLP